MMHPLRLSLYPHHNFHAARFEWFSPKTFQPVFHFIRKRWFMRVIVVKSILIRFFFKSAHNFFMLKAMAKKAKSIVTLSLVKCLNLLYCMLYFICPKTPSGSMHLFPLCWIPSSDVSLSLACRLYSFSLWLTSMIRFPLALKHWPLSGHPSHLAAW